MGRFNYSEADNYGGSGKTNFFTLGNDGDTARVRFMYNGAEDLSGYAVHEVEIDEKRRVVNCLRAYNEPKAKCPFCEAGLFQKAKLYVPVYDIDEDEVKIWERGKNFFQKMSAICSRYSSEKVPLVSHTFDVERHGKKGDTGTTYEIYETGADETLIEDLPEIPDVLGHIVLDKNADDMRYFLANNKFPTQGSTNSVSDDEDDIRPVGRRTPAGSTTRRDRF